MSIMDRLTQRARRVLSLAHQEAERMRHMLAPDAAARVERLKTGPVPEFQVRLGPLDTGTADIVADKLDATTRR